MSVILPETSRPTNLHFHDDVQVRMIDSDLYGICDDIKKISKDLFIVVASEGARSRFIIMERCEDGVDRKVFGVDELDGRVLERLRYLMYHPLAERMKILEEEERKNDEQRKEEEFDELYHRLGGPMRYQLWHDGFIEHRDKSYPKRKRPLKGIVGS